VLGIVGEYDGATVPDTHPEFDLVSVVYNDPDIRPEPDSALLCISHIPLLSPDGRARLPAGFDGPAHQ
jgi:hypothetical protein